MSPASRSCNILVQWWSESRWRSSTVSPRIVSAAAHVTKSVFSGATFLLQARGRGKISLPRPGKSVFRDLSRVSNTRACRMEDENSLRDVPRYPSAFVYSVSQVASSKISDRSRVTWGLGVEQVQWVDIPPTTRVAAAPPRLSNAFWLGFWPFRVKSH